MEFIESLADQVQVLKGGPQQGLAETRRGRPWQAFDFLAEKSYLGAVQGSAASSLRSAIRDRCKSPWTAGIGP